MPDDSLTKLFAQREARGEAAIQPGGYRPGSQGGPASDRLAARPAAPPPVRRMNMPPGNAYGRMGGMPGGGPPGGMPMPAQGAPQGGMFGGAMANPGQFGGGGMQAMGMPGGGQQAQMRPQGGPPGGMPQGGPGVPQQANMQAMQAALGGGRPPLDPRMLASLRGAMGGGQGMPAGVPQQAMARPQMPQQQAMARPQMPAQYGAPVTPIRRF